jgi:DNA-binding transcriptional MerR regulator
MEEKEKTSLLLDEVELNCLMSFNFKDEYPYLNETMTKPQFTIGDLNLSPRDANYWDKQGVLPEIKESGLRRKYDLVQSVWIKLIQQMRKLGIGLKTIELLKNDLLKSEVNIDEWKKEDVKRVVEEMNKRLDTNFGYEEMLKKLEEAKPPFFSHILMVTILFRKSLNCLVNEEGRYIVYSPTAFYQNLEFSKELHQFMSKPYFSLSISQAYRDLVIDWAPKKFMPNISILSNTEQEVLDYIRKKNVNSITIRYNEGEPYLLEIDEKYDISMEQRFLDVIVKNGYQKITVKTQKGKIVDFENKILKKLNKGTK